MCAPSEHCEFGGFVLRSVIFYSGTESIHTSVCNATTTAAAAAATAAATARFLISS